MTRNRNNVQTIEQTSKRWKGATVISGITLALGLLSGTVEGLLIAFVALVAFIVASVMAWWHHS